MSLIIVLCSKMYDLAKREAFYTLIIGYKKLISVIKTKL